MELRANPIEKRWENYEEVLDSMTPTEQVSLMVDLATKDEIVWFLMDWFWNSLDNLGRAKLLLDISPDKDFIVYLMHSTKRLEEEAREIIDPDIAYDWLLENGANRDTAWSEAMKTYG